MASNISRLSNEELIALFQEGVDRDDIRLEVVCDKEIDRRNSKDLDTKRWRIELEKTLEELEEKKKAANEHYFRR